MSEAYRQKYRSNIDRQVEEAGLTQGLKDNPGAGKPLPDHGRGYRENWWLQDFVRRQGLPAEHYLPTSLMLKRKVEQIDENVSGLRTESEVRQEVDGLNKRIRHWLKAPTSPRVVLTPIDPDAVVETWRRNRPDQEEISGASITSEDADTVRPRRRSLWSRLRGQMH